MKKLIAANQVTVKMTWFGAALHLLLSGQVILKMTYTNLKT